MESSTAGSNGNGSAYIVPDSPSNGALIHRNLSTPLELLIRKAAHTLRPREIPK